LQKQHTLDIPSNLNQGNEQDKLFIYLVPSIVPDRHCSRIPKLQEENVVQHHLA
jgi:hypothetical protein